MKLIKTIAVIAVLLVSSIHTKAQTVINYGFNYQNSTTYQFWVDVEGDQSSHPNLSASYDLAFDNGFRPYSHFYPTVILDYQYTVSGQTFYWATVDLTTINPRAATHLFEPNSSVLLGITLN